MKRFLQSLIYNRPCPIDRIRYWIQRARRGYSDEDIWGFQDYLARVIAGGIGQLRNRTRGHPGTISAEEWENILTTIEDGFCEYAETDGEGRENYQKGEDWIKKLEALNLALGSPEPLSFDFEEYKAFQRRFRHSGMLLIRWFGHLWD